MEDNRIEALFKPFDVVEGISDLPWHKDCALGRHSYDCSSMTVGISVSGADDVSGPVAHGRRFPPRADVAVVARRARSDLPIGAAADPHR